MPASQDNITEQTPMGANIIPGEGVTFRVWAPAAITVYVSGDFNGWTQDESSRLVRDPDSYPWHDQGFQMPAFNDLVIYQFHIGTYFGVDSHGNDDRRTRICTFLDVLERLEYLAELGINA